jgi:FkbH-like protein
MYETEANRNVESAKDLPAGVIAAFSELKDKIVTRTVLPWGEHCTECVWPTCYTTCDMYSPREDGRCRRFVDGMVRIDSPTAVSGYLLKIRFKQWGKLWSAGSLNLHSLQRATAIESRDYQIGKTIQRIHLAKPIKSLIVEKRYSLKKRLAVRAPRGVDLPTSFLIESFNPSERKIGLSLTLRPLRTGQHIPFQRLVSLEPGYQVTRVPFVEISSIVDLGSPFSIELIPDSFGNEATLYFGLMDFVHEVRRSVETPGKLKCIVWDLDNTLWDGVLAEDGVAGLKLKSQIRNIIQRLDTCGILQSISSKNGYQEAMQALKQFELDEFFLYPQISWSPKGEAVQAIARRLNIGIDTILFVDDQQFERQQVGSSCPGVRLLDATDYLTLSEMPECKGPVTAEGAKRRRMYQAEHERQQIREGFQDNYKAFLKDCQIELTISPLTNENLERVHELTQRTNQMNFSGNRYDRTKLRELLEQSHLDTYVLDCTDRFGSYGIVGFGMVDKREPRLTDLMFSCRIQSKRVEHAFLRSIIVGYLSVAPRDFHANYRKTTRNAPSGQVFADLGFHEAGLNDGVTSLVFVHDVALPDDRIIQVNPGNVNHRCAAGRQ